MRTSRLLVVAVLFVSIVTGGCIFGPDADPSIIVFSGELNATSDRFVMDGEIEVGGPPAENDTFTGVTVCFVGPNGTMIHQTPPRTMGPDDLELNYSVTLDRHPTYVVINSPSFWDDDNIVVRYYERERVEGKWTYRSQTAEAEIDLPGPTCKP
jgi:hypothetical protein